GQSGETPVAPAALLSSDSHDPEREVLRSERADLVRQALRRLPNRYRACLLMREAEGLSCEEIGNRLQLSSGAVRTTLCRARPRQDRPRSGNPHAGRHVRAAVAAIAPRPRRALRLTAGWYAGVRGPTVQRRPVSSCGESKPSMPRRSPSP